ncbi:hypothetical protein ACLOJK_021417 [Asimina triloba]
MKAIQGESGILGAVGRDGNGGMAALRVAGTVGNVGSGGNVGFVLAGAAGKCGIMGFGIAGERGDLGMGLGSEGCGASERWRAWTVTDDRRRKSTRIWFSRFQVRTSERLRIPKPETFPFAAAPISSASLVLFSFNRREELETDGGILALANIVAAAEEPFRLVLHARDPPRLFLLFSVPPDRALYRPLPHFRQALH